MPATGFKYGHRLSDSTVSSAMAMISTMVQETILPGVQQQLFYDNPLWERLWANKDSVKVTNIVQRVQKSKFYGMEFWDDLQASELQQQYTRDAVTFDMKKMRCPVYVSEADAKMVAMGSDPSGSELLTTLKQDMQETIVDNLGYLAYVGCSASAFNPAHSTVTGFGGTGSLNAAFSNGPDGLCAMIPYYDQDNDTTSRTYAKVPVVASGASAANTWWQPQVIYNATPPSPSLGLLYRLISQVKRRGKGRSSLILMPGAPWEAIADIIGAFQSTTFKDTQNPGFDSFKLRGVDVMADPHCPSANAEMPSTLPMGYADVTNPLKIVTSNRHLIYCIDESKLNLKVDSFDNMKFYPFESTRMTTVWAWLGWLSLQYQFTTPKRACHGVTLVDAS